MLEYDNSNPFEYYCSFGSQLKVKDIINMMSSKNYTGRFHINDVAIIFEIKNK